MDQKSHRTWQRSEERIRKEGHNPKYAGPGGRIACPVAPGQGDKKLHAGRGPSQIGTAQVEAGGPYPRTG